MADGAINPDMPVETGATSQKQPGMTIAQARTFIVTVSLWCTGILIPFFILAPVFYYPMTYSESSDVLKIIIPIFLGNISAAAAYVRYFVISSSKSEYDEQPIGVLNYLIKGPFIIFFLGISTLIISYGWTNSIYAPKGIGMPWEIFTGWISIILSIFTVTTGILITIIFPGRSSDE